MINEEQYADSLKNKEVPMWKNSPAQIMPHLDSFPHESQNNTTGLADYRNSHFRFEANEDGSIGVYKKGKGILPKFYISTSGLDDKRKERFENILRANEPEKVEFEEGAPYIEDIDYQFGFGPRFPKDLKFGDKDYLGAMVQIKIQELYKDIEKTEQILQRIGHKKTSRDYFLRLINLNLDSIRDPGSMEYTHNPLSRNIILESIKNSFDIDKNYPPTIDPNNSDETGNGSFGGNSSGGPGHAA